MAWAIVSRRIRTSHYGLGLCIHGRRSKTNFAEKSHH